MVLDTCRALCFGSYGGGLVCGVLGGNFDLSKLQIMDFKLIFNGDLQDWFPAAKLNFSSILATIAKAALSAGYRLFMSDGKIYHCFSSGGVVGYVKTGAKDGNEHPFSKRKIFEAYPDEYLSVEFRLKQFCKDALAVGKNFVLLDGSVYFTSEFDASKRIFPMISTNKYYNDEILISLCIEAC